MAVLLFSGWYEHANCGYDEIFVRNTHRKCIFVSDLKASNWEFHSICFLIGLTFIAFIMSTVMIVSLTGINQYNHEDFSFPIMSNMYTKRHIDSKGVVQELKICLYALQLMEGFCVFHYFTKKQFSIFYFKTKNPILLCDVKRDSE